MFKKVSILLFFILLLTFSAFSAGEGAFPDYKGFDTQIDMSNNVLLYHMDDPGLTVGDTSGADNNITDVDGLPVYGVGGVFNQAIYFPGDSGLNLSNGSLTGGSYPISFSLWVTIDQVPSISSVLMGATSSIAPSQQAILSVVAGTGQIRLNVNDGGGAKKITSTNSYATGEYVHIMGVMRSAIDRELYVNGVSVGTDTAPKSVPTTDTVTIGYKDNSAFHNGSIDEVAIWAQSFSDSEVVGIYNRGIGVAGLPHAETRTYPRVGHLDYYTTPGGFNEVGQTLGGPRIPKTVNYPMGAPLVADLIGNGNNYVVVWDGVNIQLYEGIDLNIVDAYATSLSNTDIKVMQIYDIDGDGIQEIIYTADGYDNVSILSWDSSGGFTLEATLALSSSQDGFRMLRCIDVNKCIVVTGERPSTAGGLDTLRVFPFNSTDMGTLKQITNGEDLYCAPRVRSISSGDRLGTITSEEDFVFSVTGYEASDAEVVYVISVSTNESLLVDDFDNTIVQNNVGFGSGAGVCHTGGNAVSTPNHFTAPTCGDFDNNQGDGTECMIGVMDSDDSFLMHVVNKNGQVAQYPQLLDADGIIVSNVIAMPNAFSDSTNLDGCVLGYNPTDPAAPNDGGDITALCVGLNQSGFDSGRYDKVVEAGLTFPTLLGYDYGPMTHAGQMDDEPTNLGDLDEIITPFGVWKMEGLGLFGTELRLTRIYDIPQANGTVVPADLNGDGRTSELLVLTGGNTAAGNLYVITDGFINSPATIGDLSFNPCPFNGQAIQNGTQFDIGVQVNDVDSDRVEAKVVLYSGTDLESSYNSDWSGLTSAGLTIPFSFTVEDLVTNGQIKVFARDSANEGSIATQTETFSVALEGLVFGQVTCSVEAEDETEEAQAFQSSLVTDQEDNAIKNFLGDVQTLPGMGGLGLTAIFFIIICVAVYELWTHTSLGTDIKMGLTGVTVVFGLILGTILGIVPTWILITLVLLVILGVIVYFSRRFTGT